MLGMMGAAFLIGLLVAMPPGAITVATAQRAMGKGFWTALHFNLGVFASDALYMGLIFIGVSHLLGESVMIRVLLFVLSGGWMIWLGIDALRFRLAVESTTTPVSSQSQWKHFRAGACVNLLNPLTIVGWTAIAGDFFNQWQPHYPPLMPYGMLAAFIMMLAALLWMLALAGLFSGARRLINMRWLHRFSAFGGLMLIGYGISALYSALALL